MSRKIYVNKEDPTDKMTVSVPPRQNYYGGAYVICFINLLIKILRWPGLAKIIVFMILRMSRDNSIGYSCQRYIEGTGHDKKTMLQKLKKLVEIDIIRKLDRKTYMFNPMMAIKFCTAEKQIEMVEKWEELDVCSSQQDGHDGVGQDSDTHGQERETDEVRETSGVKLGRFGIPKRV